MSAKITVQIWDETEWSTAAIVWILVLVLVIILVYVISYLQLSGKVDFYKPFRPKPLTEFELKQVEQKKLMREMLEQTAHKEVEDEKIEVKILTQGKDDSFFAGEEYKEFSTLNPNQEMDFIKFRFMPPPDFVNEYQRQASGGLPDENENSVQTDNLSQNSKESSQHGHGTQRSHHRNTVKSHHHHHHHHHTHNRHKSHKRKKEEPNEEVDNGEQKEIKITSKEPVR